MKKLAIGMAVFFCVMAAFGSAWCGDNGDGTVTVSGLVWLKDAGCLGWMSWDDAMRHAKRLKDKGKHGDCGLSDNSKPGDWRLPNKDELQSIRSSKNLFSNVQSNWYWSSSIPDYYPDQAFYVHMGNGYMYHETKGYYMYVWPVRSVK